MSHISNTKKNIKQGKACFTCLNFVDKLLVCSGCQCTYYCNNKCQKEDWKRHKKECCMNLDFKREKEKMENEKEKQYSEEHLDRQCIESWKSEYKKQIGKTDLMSFYESFWRSNGELYLLEIARKEAKEEMMKLK